MSVKFWHYNLVDQPQTVITATNQNAFFPAENIKDPRTTKVLRSTTTETAVTFDFTTIEDVDSILLVPHSQLGWGFTGSILVEANATNNWASPAYTTTIGPAEIDQIHNIAIKEFPVQTWRFWRLTFTNTPYVEVSKIFIGKLNNVGGRSVSFGWSYIDNDLSQSVVNRYGQKFTDVITSQKRLGFALNVMTKDQMDQFFEVYDYNRTFRPFFFQVCDCEIMNDMERFAGYFTFDQMPEIVNNNHSLYDLQATVTEAT